MRYIDNHCEYVYWQPYLVRCFIFIWTCIVSLFLVILEKSNSLEQFKPPSKEKDDDEDNDGCNHGHHHLPVINQDVQRTLRVVLKHGASGNSLS